MSLFVLFCLLQWDLLNYASPNCNLDIVRKFFVRWGAWTLFRGVPTHSKKDIELKKLIKKIEKYLLFLFYYIAAMAQGILVSIH